MRLIFGRINDIKEIMAINPTSLGLTYDLTQIESVQQSQRWVLTAMQEHGPALVTVLWRILGNEDDVCDAYQDTFLNLAHLPNHKKPRNVRGYLFRTAANTAVSMLRQKQLCRKHQDALRQTSEPPISSPVADVDSKQLQQRLREAIAELPNYLGDVVVLRDLAEMPYTQVAKMLGIGTAAARVYRHKAIKLLAMRMSTSKNGKNDEY